MLPVITNVKTVSILPHSQTWVDAGTKAQLHLILQSALEPKGKKKLACGNIVKFVEPYVSFRLTNISLSLVVQQIVNSQELAVTLPHITKTRKTLKT